MNNALSNPFRIFLFSAILLANGLFGKEKVDSDALQQAMVKHYVDSFDASLNFQHGKIAIKDVATLNIPAGYKFIPADKAEMIVHELWGNPKSDGILGMIVAEHYTIIDTNSWSFVVTYDESGYVKDEDADKINYDDLLKNVQGEEAENNKARAKEGYPSIHLLDWAAKPYYDKENKVLHWAKKVQFGDDANSTLTLNYDVRVLGRKGVLSLNAVGRMDQLADINKHIPDVLKITTFNDGNKYSDFNPSIDKVAAYTIGGLIAGKLIAKTGLIVLLLKNIKLILLAMFGGFAAFRKKVAGWFSRKKEPEYEPQNYQYNTRQETIPVAENNADTHTDQTNTYTGNAETLIDEKE
ncbi:DUF2167 domain-containing protein [Flavipsychrobacter stenotrophus]|uniref:DUF2167 domain-containing protein n=1 Tax=Flavipsychrobacter stenotrophus TaxID=2077091 RepID=A0A2S7T272_9BACT|nr:DUF2167 domain-containing protein [Flavipsychrobacter stenotrophus]PQJ12846.1 DUF2167 domain-containing protein [Flavipsychrobacter stenotrophus]